MRLEDKKDEKVDLWLCVGAVGVAVAVLG